jgi:glycosyltransferase involved in cell wall biosynthesis
LPPGAGDVWLLDHGEILGGGQRFGLRLASALKEAGRGIVVCCDPEGPLGEACSAAGIEVRGMRFPAPRPWNPAVVPALRHTRRFLSGLDPASTVIGNHPRAHALLSAAAPRTGGPAIVNIAHERETAARSLARLAYRRTGSLVAIGANAAREYHARLSGVRVTKINNFLPVGYFEHARGQRSISPDVGVLSVGVVARLIPEKGIAELAEELADAEVRPAWREAVVAGGRQDDSYAGRVERRIDELGLADRIRLIGEVDDVPGFLGSIDVLVVPSTGKEAQPTVIIEALAHGVPVVVREPLFSSDFDGLPVAGYGTPAELGDALRGPRPAPAPVDELIRRFGPEQAIAGVDAAAQLASARS